MTHEPSAPRGASDRVTRDQGEQTRARIVAAAIDLFGQRGFEGVGVRALAAAAEVSLAAINYHFGGKQGLYQACAEHIAAAIGAGLLPVAERVSQDLEKTLDQGLAQQKDVEQATEGLLTLADAVADVLAQREAESWSRFVIREQMDPSPAFDVIYGGVMAPVLQLVTRLLARVLDGDPADPQLRLRAITLLGQLLVFRAARAAAKRHLDWERIAGDEMAAIRATVRSNTRALLHGLRAEFTP